MYCHRIILCIVTELYTKHFQSILELNCLEKIFHSTQSIGSFFYIVFATTTIMRMFERPILAIGVQNCATEIPNELSGRKRNGSFRLFPHLNRDISSYSLYIEY